MLVSIVTPFFNEQDNVETLHAELNTVLAAIDAEFELIWIDDGSRDETWARIEACRARDPRILGLRLSRNFGKEAALSAGIDYARGDAVILMDGDLQHPPDMIPKLTGKLAEGYDMVYAARDGRKHDGAARSLLSRLFYFIWENFADTKIPADSGDFRIMNRKAADALKSLRERNRFMKGLYAWVGFEQTAIPYEVQPRRANKSAWSLRTLMSYARLAFISFSAIPLRIWTSIGAIIALASIGYALYIIGETFIRGRDVPGYATTITAIFFLGGVQLFSIGVLGEYLASVFDEVKSRPLYIVSEKRGGGRE